MSLYCYTQINLKFIEKWDIYDVSGDLPKIPITKGTKSKFIVGSLTEATLNKRVGWIHGQ